MGENEDGLFVAVRNIKKRNGCL